MKTTKRTIGAFAFLAALVMMVSVMTPLADAGADNSAPVLFSNESETTSDLVLRTWTSDQGIDKVEYVKLSVPETYFGITYEYALKIYLGSSAPIAEFGKLSSIRLYNNSDKEFVFDMGVNSSDWLTRGYTYPYLENELDVSKTYTISVNESNSGFSANIQLSFDYTITATTGEHGSITPSGDVKVLEGSSQTFTITPDSGYEVDKVLVDNKEASLTDGKYYTFSNVTENHSIKVTFKESGTVPQKLIIEAEAGTGGKISPSGKVEVTAGGNQTFTITPDSGYEVDKVLVDNKEVSLTDGKYTFSNVTENHKISVTFKKSDSGGGSGGGGVITTNYTITATAGSGGKINPSGNVSVKAGDSKTFTITCDSGYEVDKVLVDNEEVSLTDGKYYTFSNVTENHKISVTFKESGTVPQKLIIEAEAGKGGSISPEGKVEVTAGGNQTFTITPDSGYEVDKVLVDNEEVSLTDGKYYTFSNVTENHSIKVTFKESGETPTPSGDSGKNNTMYYIIAAIIAILIIIAIVYFFMKK